MRRHYSRSTRPFIPLFWRLFVPNAAVLAVASVVLLVEPANGRLVALVAGLAALLVINLLLMRRAFAPLSKLTALMAQADPLRPGARLKLPGPRSEVTLLAESFNEMLDRLERERRDSLRRALAAQEDERRRLAAELHDEIGQSLTALALQLNRLAEQSPNGSRGDAASARDVALQIVDDVRALARQLRPEALDELGLVPALTNLIERLSARTGLVIDRRLERDLPALAPDAELVIYRVAQESLTNVIRHAHASRAEVTLARVRGGILLAVRDDGRGIKPEPAGQGGLRFMRERAVSVGAELQIEARRSGSGTEVRLRLPADGTRR
jgi:two-component system sensor histidine kinase UhpB